MPSVWLYYIYVALASMHFTAVAAPTPQLAVGNLATVIAQPVNDTVTNIVWTVVDPDAPQSPPHDGSRVRPDTATLPPPHEPAPESQPTPVLGSVRSVTGASNPAPLPSPQPEQPLSHTPSSRVEVAPSQPSQVSPSLDHADGSETPSRSEKDRTDSHPPHVFFDYEPGTVQDPNGQTHEGFWVPTPRTTGAGGTEEDGCQLWTSSSTPTRYWRAGRCHVSVTWWVWVLTALVVALIGGLMYKCCDGNKWMARARKRCRGKGVVQPAKPAQTL